MSVDDDQSRTSTDGLTPESPGRRVLSTSKPSLSNLPSPASFIEAPITPAFRHDLVEHDESTPTRAFFDLGRNNKKGENEAEELGEIDDGVEDEVDEDEEFQSHYSRQSSPATSSDSEDDEGDDTLLGTSRSVVDLSRVERTSSMPTSTADPQHGLYNHQHMARSTTALSRGPPPLPPPLYPPFYNRPPTLTRAQRM